MANQIAKTSNILARHFNKRAVATYVFLGGNLTLLFGKTVESGILDFDLPKATAALCLIGASLCYKPSQNDSRWLYGAGGSLIAAQATIAAAAEGAGEMMQQMGAIAPSLQGVLLIRSAWNDANGKGHYKADKIYNKPLEFLDRYPIFSGAAIETPGVAAISIGAAMSGETPLALASAQWVLANIFLGASDPRIEEISSASQRFDSRLKNKASDFLRRFC